MDPGRKTSAVFIAVIATLVVVAGVLFYKYRELGGERDRLEAAHRELSSARGALKGEAESLRVRKGALEADVKALEERSSALAIEIDQRAAAAGAAGKDALAKKLADAERQAGVATSARKELSQELKVTAQGLEEAMARPAKLNKAYAALLKERSRQNAADAARRAELERTRTAFEEAQAELARLTGARGIYTVQNGDSLSVIAAFIYRDGNRWTDVFKANSFLIDGPDLIYPGQVLIVP